MPAKTSDSMNINELLKAQGSGIPKGKSVSSVINDSFQASMKGADARLEDVPMIILRHRWMKHRNAVVGITTLSFDAEGIARVPDVANARLDCLAYVRQSRGLVKIVEEDSTEEKAKVEAPKTIIPPPLEEKPKEKVKEKVEVKSKEEEKYYTTPVVETKASSKRKPPGKKPGKG